MTKPTREYEQMEHDLKMARGRIRRLQLIRTANQNTIKGMYREKAEVQDNLDAALETVARQEADGRISLNWEEGYKHGLAQCNHHPEALTTAAGTALVERTLVRGYAAAEKDENNRHEAQVGMLKTRISDLERKVGRLKFAGKEQEFRVADLERQVGRLRYTNAGLDVRIADLVRLNNNQSEIIDKGTFDEGNEEGYADGLAEGKRQVTSQDSGAVGDIRKEAHHKGFEEGLAEGKRQTERTILDARKANFERGQQWANNQLPTENEWMACPNCEDTRIDGQEFDVESTQVTQQVMCMACDTRWTEVYNAAAKVGIVVPVTTFHDCPNCGGHREDEAT